MSSKLLEAAKRLYGYVEHGLSLSPLSLVAKDLQHAIAAEEQRLADEQLPATREWILSLPGAVAEDHPAKVTFSRQDALPVGLWKVDGGWKAMLISSPAFSSCIVRGMTTRRQVLALLEAMGVRT